MAPFPWQSKMPHKILSHVSDQLLKSLSNYKAFAILWKLVLNAHPLPLHLSIYFVGLCMSFPGGLPLPAFQIAFKMRLFDLIIRDRNSKVSFTVSTLLLGYVPTCVGLSFSNASFTISNFLCLSFSSPCRSFGLPKAPSRLFHASFPLSWPLTERFETCVCDTMYHAMLWPILEAIYAIFVMLDSKQLQPNVALVSLHSVHVNTTSIKKKKAILVLINGTKQSVYLLCQSNSTEIEFSSRL